MKPYDLHIAFVSWGTDGKTRPVVILSLTSAKVTALGITSQYDNKSTTVRTKYLPIHDWKQAGLHKPSYIDIGNRVVLPLKNVYSPNIGKLSEKDIMSLLEAIETVEE